MTIAAGFKCQGGVVVCADTQELAGKDLKWSTTKVVVHERESCQAAFAGAGFGKIADMLIERIKEEIDRGSDNLQDIRKGIRSILRDAYEHEIKLLPYPEEDKIVDLIIALRPKMQQGVTLLSTHGPVDSEIHNFDVIGAGEIFRYVAESLYRRDLPISQGVLLGIHLVSLAKKYVQGVDGDTDLAIITSDGRVSLERVEFSRKQEQFFEKYNDALKDLTLSSPDTSLTNDQVFEKLEIFVDRFIELRQDYFRDVMKESLRYALSGKQGQGDVYSRFPKGQTTEQGSTDAPRVKFVLSPRAQLAKALVDLSESEKQNREAKKSVESPKKPKRKRPTKKR